MTSSAYLPADIVAESQDDTSHYLWIVILGGLAAFGAAFGIGANDVANAFATSVGSKALTIKQACAIAVVMEFIGATFLGGEVVKTIRKGIADEDAFIGNEPLLMFGCMCVMLAVGIWLLVASRLEMPVSTTHSCVGGMIGMAIAAHGSDAVVWYKDPDPDKDKPLPGGFFGVVLSWFISPILSGCFSAILFFFVRLVLRSKSPFQNSVKLYPLLVFFCVTIITLFMLMKGIKTKEFESVTDLDTGVKVGISFGVGAGVALLFIPAYMFCRKRIEDGKFVAPPLAIEVAEQREAAKTATKEGRTDAETGADAVQIDEVPAKPTTRLGRLGASLSASMNQDIHAAGENDVANAVGPFATIYMLYDGAELGSKQNMGDNKYWICGMGGIGIGVGLCLYGSQILRAIGVKLAVITPSRGFCIEMGSSSVVILGAYYGLPLSTTHCQVGATMGVAILEGAKGFDKWVIAKTAFGWVITCVFVGFIAGMLTGFGAYAPQARY